jgi:protease I
MIRRVTIIKLSIMFGVILMSSSFADNSMGQTSKKALLIVASQKFRDEELFVTKDVLRNKGIVVTVASTSTSTITGMLGGTTKPDKLISTVSAADFDAIVFIGGGGSQQYWNDATAHSLAKQAFQAGKIIAAICIAPVTLANAELLNGKKVTAFDSVTAKLTAKGAIYTGKSVQIDGNIITGNGPESAQEFGETIADALLNK